SPSRTAQSELSTSTSPPISACQNRANASGFGQSKTISCSVPMGMASTVRRMATPFQITVDCEDADLMCRFWSTALGYVHEPPPAGYLSWEDYLRASGVPVPPRGSIGAIVDPDNVGPRVLFLRVPEKK